MKGTSVIHNSSNWHRIDQDEVDENKNLAKRAEYNARSIQYVQHVRTGNDVSQCRHNVRVQFRREVGLSLWLTLFLKINTKIIGNMN